MGQETLSDLLKYFQTGIWFHRDFESFAAMQVLFVQNIQKTRLFKNKNSLTWVQLQMQTYLNQKRKLSL